MKIKPLESLIHLIFLICLNLQHQVRREISKNYRKHPVSRGHSSVLQLCLILKGRERDPIKQEKIIFDNSQGDSYISYADYAIAVLDEIEKPQHMNERFTVVGEAK